MMTAKGPENNENNKINENYVPSDYKHVDAILGEATERTLEKLLGKDWSKILNEELSPEKKAGE